MISSFFCNFVTLILNCMSLIKSISGIRGTIGGKPGEGLTPVDIVKFTSAYGMWLGRRHDKKQLMVIVGRDARRSGSMVNDLVVNTLRSLGINVTDIGLATTPTVEIAVAGTGSAWWNNHYSQSQSCRLECIEASERKGRIPFFRRWLGGA